MPIPELQKSQLSNAEETEVLEANESEIFTESAVFNQQNNFHLAPNIEIDIDKMTRLSNSNPDLADRIMKIYETRQQHSIRVDNKILSIEEREQQSRIGEKPYQRKFAFRALNFAMGLSVLSLGCSVYFAYSGHYILAGTAISIPIGVAVANMLGFKSIAQSEKKEKLDEIEEN